MSAPEDPTPSINPIDALIADYLQEVDSGKVPDRWAWLDQNPDHAEALQTFFNDFDRMDRVAAPLRMAADLDETAAVETTGLTRLTTVRYFGDYELIEEIAQGGMGVVYKARQTSLNRLVALKMILAGTFATPREVARFQAEAEAAANLDHPGIVPVYEVGEHAGQQYFSMKFIEGGSLASVPRKDIKTEVQGLIAIAKAVHHAHQHGVLHRDLKPSNVLVDPRGDRHVTDFGLAKRLAEVDRSLTEAGQILGTPRYMSPEQAAGRKDLTVAADVYALGVILYERLTGRTPFEAQSAIELLRQVREVEPPRPSGFCPALDRDLETIVLKSLEKEPASRYPTAAELEEDLTRWQEGRPIAARPVGQTEKFIRWCRRNPVVAGLTASVVMALLMGVIVSSLFAYQERKARIRAEMAEDTTERALARSLVRPLNVDGVGSGTNEAIDDPSYLSLYQSELKRPALSQPEIEALRELSSQQTERLRLRFVEEAIREPLTLSQLQARSEPAMIATLGLDSNRREKVVQILGERLQRPTLSLEDKINLSLLILQASVPSDPKFQTALTVILRAVIDDIPAEVRKSLEIKIAGSDCDWITAAGDPRLLVDAFARANSLGKGISLPVFVKSVGEVDMYAWPDFKFEKGSLDRAKATLVARSIADKIPQVKEESIQFRLFDLVVKLTNGCDPVEVTSICRPVARSLLGGFVNNVGGTSEYDQGDYDHYGELIDYLESNEAKALRQSLVQPLLEIASNKKTKLVDSATSLLSRLLSGLDRASVEAFSGQLAVSMEREFRSENTSKTYNYNCVRYLSKYLTPADAEKMVPLIVEAIRTEKGWGSGLELSEGLNGIKPKLDKARLSRVCGPLARSIIAEIGTKSAVEELSSIDKSVVWHDPDGIFGKLDKLIALTDCLEASEAETVSGLAIRTVLPRFERIQEIRALDRFVEILKTLANHLNPLERSTLLGPFARSIAENVGRDGAFKDRVEMARLLRTLVKTLDKTERDSIFGQATRSLAHLLVKEGNLGSILDLAESLAVLTPELNQVEANQICIPIAQSIVERLAREKNPVDLAKLAKAFSDVIGVVDRFDVAPLCGVAARLVLNSHQQLTGERFVERTKTGGTKTYVWSLFWVLRSILVKHDFSEGLLTARLIIQLLELETDLKVRASLADSLSQIANRLDPQTAFSFAPSVVEFLGQETDPDVLASLAAALVSLTNRPRDERKVRWVSSVFQFSYAGIQAAPLGEILAPEPCLPSQDLVELLKMPTILGYTRRLVLDELGNIHGRRFANHWEFVRFAQESGLKLDFTSPPRRHEKASVGR